MNLVTRFSGFLSRIASINITIAFKRLTTNANKIYTIKSGKKNPRIMYTYILSPLRDLGV